MAFALCRRAVVVRGAPAVILLLGLLVLPYLLAGSLSPEEVERGVREYLLREVRGNKRRSSRAMRASLIP